MEKGPSPGGVDSGPSLVRRATEGVVAHRVCPNHRSKRPMLHALAAVILHTGIRVGAFSGQG